MKRINNRAAAVEAVNTRHDTVVGPFMTTLTGYPELTPYQGGWCGNDLFPEALSEEHRAVAIEHVRRLGDRLRREGLHRLMCSSTSTPTAVYLGELDPRISGASSMTNVTAGAYADIPLFLFHLLEFMDVDYEVDIDELNERWRELAAVDVWSQLIVKETVDSVARILEAPRTVTWHLEDDGSLRFVRVANDWHDLTHEDECCSCASTDRATTASREPISASSSPRGRCKTADGLTQRCRRYIDGIRSQYISEKLPETPTLVPIGYVK